MKKASRYTSGTKALTLDFPQKLFATPKISFLVNVRFLLISGIILTILFLGFYIFQITVIISQGYQIESYQKKIEDITEKNKILEINALKMNSLEAVDSRVQELGFEKVDKINYIQVLDGPVVTANKKME